MKLRLLGSFLALLVCGSAQAGESPAARGPAKRPPANYFITLGSGAGNVTYRDRLSSDRVFSGPAFGGFQSAERVAQGTLMYVDAHFLLGAADNDLDDWVSTTVPVTKFRGNMGILFFVPTSSRLQWYVGPGLQSYGMFRVNPAHGNAAVGFDLSNNLGFRNRLEYPIPFKVSSERSWWIFKFKKSEYRNLRLGLEVDLPLFGFQSRPAYTGVFDAVGNDPVFEVVEEFINHTRLKTVGQFFYLQSRAYFQYPLKNGNRLQMSYLWHGYGYNYLDMPVRTASGALLFSFMFRLDAKPEVR